MAIPVKREPQEITKGFGNLLEKCFFCKDETHYWHEASNTPICPFCADEKDVSDIIKITHSIRSLQNRLENLTVISK